MEDPGSGGASRIEVATDKLRDEGKRWLGIADDLHDAINKVKLAQCREGAFSFMDLEIGVADAYEQARKDLKEFAEAGEKTLNQLGKALKAAADQFDADDDAGKHRIDKAVDEWSTL